MSICRKHGHNIPLKEKRSSNYSKDFGCCGTATFISQPGTRKDVLVRNPKNVRFAKKIIVGNQFRQLLKALYRDHSKDAQAIKRKINDGHFQLSGSKGEDKDAKASIYNIEDKSDASKNKTIIELRVAILKLLDKVVKKAGSAHIANQKDHRQNVSSQVSEKRHSSKTAKTEIQESYKDTSHRPLNDDEELSAKRANYLDLLNFIARMKSEEIGPDLASRHRLNMPTSLNGVEFNGLNGMVNTRDMMEQNYFPSTPPTSEYAQNGLPGNGLQMKEMNLAEQRRLIEDQMENHIAQLQMKAKLQEDQQNALPMQNFRNFNFMRDLQTPMTTQSDGPNPFGFRVQPMFHQPSFLPRVNPYLPFARPLSRLRTGLPFFRPVTPRVRYPLGNEDEDDDDDDADEDSDYDRDRDEPPPHHLERGYEDVDKDDVDEEQSDAENDER